MRMLRFWRQGALGGWVGLLLATLAGCDGGPFAGGGDPRFDSPWRRMEPQRITRVKSVDYDVNLRWFTGAERALMVHRVDKQPMFDLAFEQDHARAAVSQAYAGDVCFGAPLTIEGLVYERPGVWVVHGRCPVDARAPGAPAQIARAAEPSLAGRIAAAFGF